MSKKQNRPPLAQESLITPFQVVEGVISRILVTVRLREMPPGLAAMTMPSDKTVECDPSLAEILIEQGYADAL